MVTTSKLDDPRKLNDLDMIMYNQVRSMKALARLCDGAASSEGYALLEAAEMTTERQRERGRAV